MTWRLCIWWLPSWAYICNRLYSLDYFLKLTGTQSYTFLNDPAFLTFSVWHDKWSIIFKFSVWHVKWSIIFKFSVWHDKWPSCNERRRSEVRQKISGNLKKMIKHIIQFSMLIFNQTTAMFLYGSPEQRESGTDQQMRRIFNFCLCKSQNNKWQNAGYLQQHLLVLK